METVFDIEVMVILYLFFITPTPNILIPLDPF